MGGGACKFLEKNSDRRARDSLRLRRISLALLSRSPVNTDLALLKYAPI